jgi:hypothetical protein
MSYIILKYKVPEESEDALTSINAWKWKAVVHDLSESLRAVSKYESAIDGSGKATEQEIEFATRVREKIFGLLTDYNLEL